MAMHDMRLETKQAALAIEDVELDGSFSGYASVFGLPDLGNDVIERGAFARSLAKGGVSGVRMLWQHDASEPIGVWTAIREDARGLYVEGRLAKGVARARDALELMRGGGLDGLSIGFRTVKARKDARTGLRHIIEADLWEISVVTFPMLPQARVSSVKATLPTTREFERWLMRDAGLSRTAAKTVIAKGFAALAAQGQGQGKGQGRDAHLSSQDEGLAQRMRAAAKMI
ncbi:HK97 family phage prohead protease [Brucella anthropi]|uniref:HK97 family phage prohead protease n=1 Tax=Brucella anthropi TaxID=529 RepID=UPI000F6777BF|nr:HK97 family phage prohead protease [Brucella anthropi]QPB10650.1 prohead protease [Bacteriophage sp. 103231]KAB2746761.1 HK97 family phage prohead protease [Brucella anthropi]KAB2777237.1 HK97 family phage prohead protease [Brucella anthropi]RRY06240.1 HK97 family phage prohead protease [Brucella anthropi]UGQ21781.1 HK97 family phage prohead protease [Brucella anthropi]